jgi:hypothetical protein
MVAEVLRKSAEVLLNPRQKTQPQICKNGKSSMKSIAEVCLRKSAEVCGSRSKSSMKSMRRFAEVFAEVGPLVTVVKEGGCAEVRCARLGRACDAPLARWASPKCLRPLMPFWRMT